MDLRGRLRPRCATCDGEYFRPAPILHRRSGLDRATCCGDLCSFILHCWGPAATPRSCAAKGVHKQHSTRCCAGAAQPCSTIAPAPLTGLEAFVRAGAAHRLRALACPRARASRLLCKHDRPRDAATDGCKQAGERPWDGCRCVEARGAAGGAPKRRRSGRAGRFACRGARRARKAVRKLLARTQRARWMHARLVCLSAAMVPRVHRL